jgi:hypothetical protein
MVANYESDIFSTNVNIKEHGSKASPQIEVEESSFHTKENSSRISGSSSHRIDEKKPKKMSKALWDRVTTIRHTNEGSPSIDSSYATLQKKTDILGKSPSHERLDSNRAKNQHHL